MQSLPSLTGGIIAQLTVRKLDRDLIRRLKIRAAQLDQSAEAEHRGRLRRDR